MDFIGLTAQIRQLGMQAYEPVWREMQRFTQERNESTRDEIWVLEHYPVYTLGQNGQEEHVLNPGNIPVIKTDRGGQVTYHGPGQLIVYPLIDIKRSAIGIRQLVTILEESMIAALSSLKLFAYAKPEAPGVYIDNKKIGSIGIRIKNHASYHGISLNNHLDLAPFTQINPCGYKNLQVTQLKDFGITISTGELAGLVVDAIGQRLYS